MSLLQFVRHHLYYAMLTCKRLQRNYAEYSICNKSCSSAENNLRIFKNKKKDGFQAIIFVLFICAI